VPQDLQPSIGTPDTETYLQQLNQDLLTHVERSGDEGDRRSERRADPIDRAEAIPQ
jgi:hypothetical protein